MSLMLGNNVKIYGFQLCLFQLETYKLEENNGSIKEFHFTQQQCWQMDSTGVILLFFAILFVPLFGGALSTFDDEGREDQDEGGDIIQDADENGRERQEGDRDEMNVNRPTDLDNDGLSDEDDGLDSKRNEDVDNRSKDNGDNLRNKNNNDNTDDYDEESVANNRGIGGAFGRQDHWDDLYGNDHEDRDETIRRRKVWREKYEGKGVKGAVRSEYRVAADAYKSAPNFTYACLGTLIYLLANAF